MSSFITEELVWAITREREEEARKVRPHTERKDSPKDSATLPPGRGGHPSWLSLHPTPNR
jgi:hypothetical protein